ncbi:MAG: FtsQ-type POTRA domain-containing protein [Oscillospiraceae bacterium]|nr:FtsQ-type POTRA domain-containing protein [Oscillospiraceae bacterium]
MKKRNDKKLNRRSPSGGNAFGQTSRGSERRKGKAAPKRRRRRGNNILLYLLILFFMLSITVVLVFTVFFKIKAVEVTGGERYRPDKLIATSGILLEENMFRLDDGAIEETMVSSYSYIQSVHIRRKLPDTVVLEITEATPMGAIDQGTGYIIVSDRGRVLEKGVPNPPDGIPVVRGIDVLSLGEGEYIPEESAGQLQLLRQFISAASASGFSYFTLVDLSDSYNLMLYYGDQITYLLGSQAELDYKLASIRKVADQEGLLESFTGTVDASIEGEVWTRPSKTSRPMIPAANEPQEEDGGQESSSQEAQSEPEEDGTEPEEGSGSGEESSSGKEESSSEP